MYLNLSFRGNQCLPRKSLKQNNEESSNWNGFEIIYLNNWIIPSFNAVVSNNFLRFIFVCDEVISVIYKYIAVGSAVLIMEGTFEPNEQGL